MGKINSNRRTAILKAARNQFIKGGLYQPTLQTIAEEVGIPAGNLYYFYRTKTELLNKAVPDYIDGSVKPNSDEETRLLLDIKLHKNRKF